MKLSKKLQEESVKYLQNYLAKKRKRPLSLTKKNIIKLLIEFKKKENREFAGQIVDSGLCKLACVQLVREGKAKGIRINNELKYEVNPALVLLKMTEVIDNANQKGLKDTLNGFLKEK